MSSNTGAAIPPRPAPKEYRAQSLDVSAGMSRAASTGGDTNMPQDRFDATTERALDGPTVLPGEDPASMLVEDAVHWIRVYGELLGVKAACWNASTRRVVG